MTKLRNFNRTERLLLVGCMALALALHLFWVRGPRVVWGDEPFYLWLGRNWLTGQGYQFLGFTDVHHPPLYPLLSGLVYLVVGNLEAASNVLYVIFGTLLVLPLAGLGRRLYGPRVGLLAGLLAALYPPLTAAVPWWGTMTEPPFYFFVALGLWAAVASLGRVDAEAAAGDDAAASPAWWGLAGLAFGLAYLTRPEGIWYVPAVGAALLLVAWLRRTALRTWFIGGALFALGFFLCFFPYAVHTRINTGGWMVSEKVGITFQDSLALAQNDLVEHDRILWQLDSSGEQVFFFSRESFHLSMLEQIRADPRLYARVLALNVQTALSEFFTAEGYLPALLPLLGLALFGVPWSRRRWRGELLLLAATLPPLTFLLFFIFTRYLSPLLLPMLLWTALGLDRLGAWAAGTAAALLPRTGDRVRRAAWALPVVAVCGLCLIMQPRVAGVVGGSSAVRWEHRLAGEWLAAHAAPGDVVMARYPAAGFYAERHWIPSPNSDLPAALRYGAANSADWWIVDGTEAAWRPQLAALAAGMPSAGLELAYRVPSDGQPVYIYHLR